MCNIGNVSRARGGNDASIRETDVERQLKLSVAKAGGICLKFFSASQAGYPDRIVLLPGGRQIWVELKAPGRKPRPLQLKAHEKLRALGQDVRVIDSIEDAKALPDEV